MHGMISEALQANWEDELAVGPRSFKGSVRWQIRQVELFSLELGVRGPPAELRLRLTTHSLGP